MYPDATRAGSAQTLPSPLDRMSYPATDDRVGDIAHQSATINVPADSQKPSTTDDPGRSQTGFIDAGRVVGCAGPGREQTATSGRVAGLGSPGKISGSTAVRRCAPSQPPFLESRSAVEATTRLGSHTLRGRRMPLEAFGQRGWRPTAFALI